MDETGGIERRRFPRLACRAAVQVRDLFEPGASPAGGLSGNVSVGGLRFQSERFLPQTRLLLVQLTLPGASAPFRTIVRVVWTAKQLHTERYDVGAEFIEVASQDLRGLADYVERGIRFPDDVPTESR